MKPSILIVVLIILCGCTNQEYGTTNNNTDTIIEKGKDVDIKADTFSGISYRTISKAPFKYGCNLANNLHLSSRNPFKSKKLEGLLWAGKLEYENQCPETEYHLFFGVGDIHWPYIYVKYHSEEDTLFQVFDKGCEYLDEFVEEHFELQTNGMISVITHTEYLEEKFDTTYIDLKHWCD